jgi:hypothetical protein
MGAASLRKETFVPHCTLRALSGVAAAFVLAATPALAEPTELLWGDTHLHSSNSFDAYLNRNMTADPATAYAYARGLPVIHPFHRARVQIETPLDFLVVADHAEYLGVIPHVVDEGIPREGLGLVDRIRARLTERYLRGVVEDDAGMQAFTSLLPVQGSVEEAAAIPRDASIPASNAMMRSTWQEAIRTADLFNDPGRFSAIIGWEWSAIPAGANLHRVVFTSADAGVASQFQPWSSIDSQYPEDLWAWLAETSQRTGAEFVSIPHNSNISKGYMFRDELLKSGAYTTESAKNRLRWEPVVEVTQIKGDSETHPAVSPDDPFADFETYPYYIQQDAPAYDPGTGDYVRSALRLGLSIEERIGFNPYRFGLIGSTDAHTGMASAEEPNFWGKLARDSIPENKARFSRAAGPSGWSMSAQGLAAVWATENTREAILDAFRRREVYATTGPRIAVRVFGGWSFRAAHAKARSIEKVGYARGVPMGSVLPAKKSSVPRFLVHAMKDPKSAHLDRVQMVKGWIEADGNTRERVHDIAWSGKRAADADGRVPAVGSTVDLATASYTNDIGAPVLSTVWRDPDFDPEQPCFYYVRVLEIPTPRHSVFDALALGEDPASIEGGAEIQERAYTSPIWYQP